MGTRFPKPKHFQEVHPWSVNILGLDIPWDSLSEMCEWVLETPVEVEHVSWDFQPERALLSSGYVSYLPGGLGCHPLSSEPRFPLLQNTDGNIERQRLNWMQCLTREDPQEVIAVIKMPQHKAGSPQPTFCCVCELCGFSFFKIVSLFIIFFKVDLKKIMYLFLAGWVFIAAQAFL